MTKKFKMEKVLELREKALEKEKIKLSELIKIEEEIRAERQVIADDINQKSAELEEDRQNNRFDFIDMYNKYIKLRQKDLIKDLIECETRRKQAEQNIINQKEVLRKALNDVKVMEKLKEKHLQAYQEYVKKQEEMQIDEINITRGFKE